MTPDSLNHGLLHDEEGGRRVFGRERKIAAGALVVLGIVAVVVVAGFAGSTMMPLHVHKTVGTAVTTLLESDNPAMWKIPQITEDELLRKLPGRHGSKSYMRDIVESLVPGKEMTGGLYLMNKGPVLKYTYLYEEFQYVVWGEWHLTDGAGNQVVAEKGDLMYFPRGSTITYSTPNKGLGYFVGQRKSPESLVAKDADVLAAIKANPAMQHFPQIASDLDRLPKLPGSGSSKSFLGDLAFSRVPGKEMTAGLYHLEKGPALHYTYTYEEFKYILHGEFHLTDGTGQEVVARQGDLMYFPRGAKVTFSTMDGALGLYVGQRTGVPIPAPPPPAAAPNKKVLSPVPSPGAAAEKHKNEVERY